MLPYHDFFFSKMDELCPLPQSFYTGICDPPTAAKSLLGKVLWKSSPLFGARIVETEGYGPNDRASHGYKYKKTRSNSAMFEIGGTLYVASAYGIHKTLNIVFAPANEPVAVLIRAVELLSGGSIKGPGNVGRAFGATKLLDGSKLTLAENHFWISPAENQRRNDELRIVATPRIGLNATRCGEDALLKWRFFVST